MKKKVSWMAPRMCEFSFRESPLTVCLSLALMAEEEDHDRRLIYGVPGGRKPRGFLNAKDIMEEVNHAEQR